MMTNPNRPSFAACILVIANCSRSTVLLLRHQRLASCSECRRLLSNYFMLNGVAIYRGSTKLAQILKRDFQSARFMSLGAHSQPGAPSIRWRAGRSLVDKVDLRCDRDDAALVAQIEERADGLAAVGAIVEGAVVDVHADEATGEAGIEIAGELHGVFEGGFAVVEGVLNAVVDGLGDDTHGFGAQRAADGVAAQRQHRPVVSRHQTPRSRTL